MDLKQYIIPAIDDLKKLQPACQTPAPVVFLMKANICNLKALVQLLHKHHKQVYVHIEFMDGFKPDKEGLKLLKNEYQVDGIVSANAKALVMAQSCNLQVVYRLFLVDSISLKRSQQILLNNDFSTIEVLPAINALKEVKLLQKIFTHAHLIAGGFVRDQALIKQIFDCGFQAVDSSDVRVWPTLQPHPAPQHGK